MKYLSVCSGIEAATVAWEPLGFTPVAFAEVEPFPCAVLAHHYPGVPNLGDMTKIKGEDYRGIVDVLVGGTPCQAFSVSGLRQGLADARGGLTPVFARLADAIKPKFVVWENVPGVLSDKTNAFGCLLGTLAGEDDSLVPPRGRWTDAGFVLGPERAVAWRVLDAQYFGLAQRRRRVFLVACPRDGADPREVLFEREGLRRDTAPSRETGKGVAPTLAARTRGGGGLGTDFDCGGNNTSGPIDVATARNAHAGPHGRLDFETETFCVHATQDPIVGRDRAHAIGSNMYQAVQTAMQVRRLTPTECERLQGFPDGYTAIPWRNKPASECPDGPRYKALGNSMAVPVMRWIGQRIDMVSPRGQPTRLKTEASV